MRATTTTTVPSGPTGRSGPETLSIDSMVDATPEHRDRVARFELPKSRG